MKKSKFLIVFASVLLMGAFLVPMLSQAAPAQVLDFYVVDSMIYEQRTNIITGKVIHVNDYECTHVILEGYIGDSPITGHLDSYLKVNHNLVTNKMTVNGISIFYITWNDYEGGFSGVKAMNIDSITKFNR